MWHLGARSVKRVAGYLGEVYGKCHLGARAKPVPGQAFWCQDLKKGGRIFRRGICHLGTKVMCKTALEQTSGCQVCNKGVKVCKKIIYKRGRCHLSARSVRRRVAE